MAVSKTLIANGSKGHHRFTLTVNEDRTSGNSSFMSYSFTVSPIQSGWDWDASGVAYYITIGSNNYSGYIFHYGGYSTEVVASITNLEIPHDADGTKSIAVSFSVVDSTSYPFTPGSASASDTLVLTALHKAPDITNAIISAENNSQLTTLGLATGTIAQFLSNKTFTISATFYDDATASSYSIYHNNVLIGTSSTNAVQINFQNVDELQTTLSEGVNYVGLVIAVTDSKNGRTTALYNFPVIKYTRPTYEATSSNIKRKTTGGTTLTDEIATLSFVGTCYKGNDVIGNNNTPLVQYKIWNTTEPSYTNVTTPNTANISISNVDISNIDYLKVYDYKIKISDTFTNADTSDYVKSGQVPTGVSVWSEYKDHVDFLKLTVNKNNPFEYIDSEIQVGTWNENGNETAIFRQVFVGTSTTSDGVTINLSNLNADIIVNVYGWVKSIYGQWWPINNHYPPDSHYDTSLNYTHNNSLAVHCESYFSYPEYRIIIEYTKTSN